MRSHAIPTGVTRQHGACGGPPRAVTAQTRGVGFGLPKLSAHQRREAIDRIQRWGTLADVARTFGID
jgi:hypothetical protein